jgi:hypothetical protein
MASYRLSFGASLIGAFLNVIFGGIVAWVLVRYRFPASASSMRWWTCLSPAHGGGRHCPDRAVFAERLAGQAARPWASRWPSRRWACWWR